MPDASVANPLPEIKIEPYILDDVKEIRKRFDGKKSFTFWVVQHSPFDQQYMDDYGYILDYQTAEILREKLPFIPSQRDLWMKDLIISDTPEFETLLRMADTDCRIKNVHSQHIQDKNEFLLWMLTCGRYQYAKNKIESRNRAYRNTLKRIDNNVERVSRVLFQLLDQPNDSWFPWKEGLKYTDTMVEKIKGTMKEFGSVAGDLKWRHGIERIYADQKWYDRRKRYGRLARRYQNW